MYLELLNYIIFVLFAIKANLAIPSFSEGVTFRKRNCLAFSLEEPYREEKTTGNLFSEEVLYGQVQKRAAVCHFPVVLQQMQAWVYGFPYLFFWAVTYLSCSFLLQSFWLYLLSGLVSNFGSNISCYRDVVKTPVNFRESFNVRTH